MNFHSITNPKKINLSIGILSSAIIAFQISLIQFLSVTQWYHFAFMVISVALLGFGAAGTFLSIFKNTLLKFHELILPILLILSGVLMVATVKAAHLNFIRFDSILILNDPSHFLHLIFTYLLFFLPFFFGALVIGLIFIIYKDHISKIYFANLIGSGIGGMIILSFMWIFSIKLLPVIIAFLPIIAGIVLLKKTSPFWLKILSYLSAFIMVLFLFYPPKIIPSEYKSLSKSLLLPDSKIVYEKNSPFGLTTVISSPALRSVPGLSLTYTNTVPVNKAIFVNGNWSGSIKGINDSISPEIFKSTTNYLPFLIKKPKNILCLNTGICEYTSFAIDQNIKKITITEPNSSIISVTRSELQKDLDPLLSHPSLEVKNIEARTYISQTKTTYDIILLPKIGVFGGDMGVNSFQEQYLFTLEAFEKIWDKLSDDGIISISCYLDHPPRKPLRLLATIAEMFENKAINSIKNHVIAIRNWNYITFAIQKSPISILQEDAIRAFCNKMSFDPLILKSLQRKEQEKFNILNNEYFFESIRLLLSENKKTFYETYDFNIAPTTDNCPYFFQFIKGKNIKFVSEILRKNSMSLIEIGYIIVLITFLQILLFSTILIIIPLFQNKFIQKNKFNILLYFSGIGIGYMFFEIILIQQFILYLGNPIYSATGVISLLLISSGFGSNFSSKKNIRRKNILLSVTSIALILIFYAFILIPLLQYTNSFPLPIKLFFMFLTIAIPGFLMGMPFPMGLSYYSKNNINIIPWGWGINGYLSVISTALATIIAIEAGFLWVLLLAGIMYLLTGFSMLKA